MKTKIFGIIANVLCLACLLGTTIYLIAAWKSIPDMVPSHFNAAGEIDSVVSKSTLLLLPIMGWLMFIMFSVIEHFPQMWNTGVNVTQANMRRVYAISKSLLLTIKLLIVVDFTYIEICTINNVGLSVWSMPVFLVMIFGSIIVHMIMLFKAGKKQE